jgi:hypothetical protein
MRHLFISAVFLISAGQAGAVTLAAIADPPVDRLPVIQDAPNYSCAEVTAKLEQYNTMAREHDQSVVAFLGQVTSRLSEWYAALSPLEGKSEPIAAGQFQVLQDGSEKISKITDSAGDNSQLLANELDRIIVSFKQCKITN